MLDNEIKIIAWHLPQYHVIKENDEWWGENFTEWTNVKKAKPLYKNHNQPRIPLNNNYYNLLDKATMQWQYDLSQKYGIYGFCYYHYWFNGKLLLEKPVENLLKWKDINQKFCFSWANQEWSRTWIGNNKQILIQQEYGQEKEWAQHFDYLLPFFQDERYIKIDGKPLFLIYKTNEIPNLNRFIDFFNERAINNNLQGIYIIETLNSYQLQPFANKADGYVWFEPMASIAEIGQRRTIFTKIFSKIKNFILKIFLKPIKVNSKKIINNIEHRPSNRFSSKKEYWSFFCDWDNSARKERKAFIVDGMDEQKFELALKIAIEKSSEDIIFANAWNEWAEGTYLEPDTKNKYKYLEIIQKALQEKSKNFNSGKIDEHSI